MKQKSNRRLIIALLIGIASIAFWTYRNIAMHKTLLNLSDATDNVAKAYMTETDFLSYKFSTSVAPAVTITSIWLAWINGFMVAMSFVLIYTEIKKIRGEKI